MKQAIQAGSIPALKQKQEGICISIIIPTNRLPLEKRADRIRLDKAIQKAKEYLFANYSPEEIESLAKAIDELHRQVDFDHSEEGIGLFVSPGFQQLIQFYCPVKEKVIISDAFEIKDLLYQEYYLRPYLVLMLSEKEARLFKAQKNILEEIHSGKFPQKNDAQYEYSRPIYGSANARNTFIKTIERDKSQLEEIRYERFLRQVDKGLSIYLTGDLPLIVTGVKKDLANFKKVTQHAKKIIGQVPGNHAHLSANELAGLTWNAAKSFFDASKQQQVTDLEKSRENNSITGIREIWKAVQEGRGSRLLLEKDYTAPGFLRKGYDHQLYLRPPKGQHRVLPDVVNTLIQTMLEKNGDVVVLENNELPDHQRIVLIPRY